MSEELLKLLDDRDAEGERSPKLRAGFVDNGPVNTPSFTQSSSQNTAPVLRRSYWSPAPDPLMYDDTRSKTEQARSGTGYMEVLSTTFVDGAELYDTPLGGGRRTRTY